jgi:hypothetical protein
MMQTITREKIRLRNLALHLAHSDDEAAVLLAREVLDHTAYIAEAVGDHGMYVCNCPGDDDEAEWPGLHEEGAFHACRHHLVVPQRGLRA